MLKVELGAVLNGGVSRTDVRSAVVDYLDFYNTQRRHSASGLRQSCTVRRWTELHEQCVHRIGAGSNSWTIFGWKNFATTQKKHDRLRNETLAKLSEYQSRLEPDRSPFPADRTEDRAAWESAASQY